MQPYRSWFMIEQKIDFHSMFHTNKEDTLTGIIFQSQQI